MPESAPDSSVFAAQIASNIRLLIESPDNDVFSLRDLALRCGFHPSAFPDLIERSPQEISVLMLWHIADTFRCRVADLCMGAQEIVSLGSTPPREQE